MPAGQIPRVGVRLFALGFDLLVHPLEVVVVHVDFAADFQDRRRRCLRTVLRSDSGIDLIVRALTVTSSPDVAAPARRGQHQPAILVSQADRRAVDLRLQHIRRLLAAERLAHPLVEGAHLLLAVRVVDAHHRHGVPDRLQLRLHVAADALRGRIGRDKLRDAPSPGRSAPASAGRIRGR